jgi:hypothetical protein
MNRNIEYFRRLHDVAKQIVDDGSADADTVAALKSATMELVTQYDDSAHALKTLYLGDTELSSDLRKAAAIVGKYDDDDAEEIEKARNRDYVGAQGLASAIMDHALDRLAHLRRRGGFEKKESTPMQSIEMLKAERKENLLAIGKSGGAVAMAKILVADNDAHGIDESEYTQIVTEHAQKLYPDKAPDSAFARVFSDTGPDGVALRKGHAVVRASQPTMVGGVDATNEANDELMVKAAELRKAQPNLTEAQAFAKVFTDPKNALLAAKAHVRPTAPAGGAYPHPR